MRPSGDSAGRGGAGFLPNGRLEAEEPTRPVRHSRKGRSSAGRRARPSLPLRRWLRRWPTTVASDPTNRQKGSSSRAAGRAAKRKPDAVVHAQLLRALAGNSSSWSTAVSAGPLARILQAHWLACARIPRSREAVGRVRVPVRWASGARFGAGGRCFRPGPPGVGHFILLRGTLQVVSPACRRSRGSLARAVSTRSRVRGTRTVRGRGCNGSSVVSSAGAVDLWGLCR